MSEVSCINIIIFEKSGKMLSLNGPIDSQLYKAPPWKVFSTIVHKKLQDRCNNLGKVNGCSIMTMDWIIWSYLSVSNIDPVHHHHLNLLIYHYLSLSH